MSNVSVATSNRAIRLAIPIATFLAMSCGVDRTEHENTVRERDELAQRIALLESEKDKLTTDLNRLRQTDQGMWDELVAHQKSGEWGIVEEGAGNLIARWPASPLVVEARKIRTTAREKIADSLYADAQKAIRSNSASQARLALERLANDYSETSMGRRAGSEIRTLDRQLAAASKEQAKQAREETRRRARANSTLELTAFSWHTEHGYAIVEGLVKNISSTSLENVQAVAIFDDSNGNFITSGSALIEYRPILPGQSSPFKVMAPENPAMKTSRVEFKEMFGSAIPTVHSWRKE